MSRQCGFRKPGDVETNRDRNFAKVSTSFTVCKVMEFLRRAVGEQTQYRMFRGVLDTVTTSL